MLLRECDGCEEQIAEHDIPRELALGRAWVSLGDASGWRADACSAACALSVLRDHLQEVTELAVVR